MEGWSNGARAAAATVILSVTGLVAAVLTAVPAGASPAPTGNDVVVVKLSGSGLHAASVLQSAPATPSAAPGGRYVYKMSAGAARSFVNGLRGNPKVAYAEISPRVHAAAVAPVTPDDPCYTGCVSPAPVNVENGDTGNSQTGTFNQANLQTIHAPQAWGYTKGNPNLLVAVLDTGVDATQPDLVGKVTVGPTLCQDSGDPPSYCTSGDDQAGHGTHVTGIIAANTNNAAGIAGLGWNVHVEMFKVLDNLGNGSDADVVSGIYDAVSAGAKVINMSLAGGVCGTVYQPAECPQDPDLTTAIAYAIAHGVTVVAAAGNDSSSIPEYPAATPGVLSVAATDNSGNLASFSEYGAAANIAAPGENILSTWKQDSNGNDNYATLSGTSMATPEVSAAAALVLSVDPSLTPAQVGTLLEQTSTPIPGNPISGGLLDVGAAVAKAASGTYPPSPGVNGYEIADAAGNTYSFGLAPPYGSVGQTLNKPVVGVAANAGDSGYWLTASDGGVFNFGDAKFYGSTGNIRLNKPVVGMAATPDGKGYWLVAADGGIFNFGDAGFYGSLGNIRLNKPVVGMVATPDGKGYWLVAADGGVFNFGDAGFYGSTGNVRLNKPVVGMAATPDGKGYWLVAADGGIFNFGDAGFYGSTGNVRLNKPVVGMAPSPTGDGYWLVAADGGIFNFGDAPFEGSAAAADPPLPAAAVGMGA